MTLAEEYLNSHKRPPTDPAKRILFAVLRDLFDRRGIRQFWDGVDADVQEELLTTNIEIVRKNLPR